MHKIANGSGDYCMYLEMACCFERKYSTGGICFGYSNYLLHYHIGEFLYVRKVAEAYCLMR